MYRVRWPWASRSRSRTRCPSSASAAPRLTAVVVLPTPPFCIATAIVRAKIETECKRRLSPSLRARPTVNLPRAADGAQARVGLYNAAGLVIDIAIAVLLILALVLGYQRGVIQPLLAEIFFFGTLLVIFRFHDTYTNEMEKIAHLNAVFSVAVAIVAAVILGAVGGAIGGAFH